MTISFTFVILQLRFLQLYASLKQLLGSFRIWKFWTHNPKAKTKGKKVNIAAT